MRKLVVGVFLSLPVCAVSFLVRLLRLGCLIDDGTGSAMSGTVLERERRGTGNGWNGVQLER